MLPNSKVAPYSFRRVIEPCGVCGASLNPPDDHRGRERAFDSLYDLFNPSGNSSRIPDIFLPIGTPDLPRVPIFRASICEDVDRFSIYLVTTIGNPQNPAVKPGDPNTPDPMFLDIRIGIDCVEETVVTFTFAPPTYQDGGHLVTFASPQLFGSIVITGVSLVAKGHVAQGVGLRIMLDRAGICCPDNPIFGPMVQKPQ